MHLVLFKIGDTAGLIANASLNELLRDTFGSPGFGKSTVATSPCGAS
jgi:hypothetical protein